MKHSALRMLKMSASAGNRLAKSESVSNSALGSVEFFHLFAPQAHHAPSPNDCDDTRWQSKQAEAHPDVPDPITLAIQHANSEKSQKENAKDDE